MIEHTYRAAVKAGEDYITVEQKVILAPDANDAQIAQAVATAERIFAAQQESVERQIAAAHAGRMQQSAPANGGANYGGMREPESPATDAQRRFIATLQDKLGWTSEQLIVFAGVDLVDLSKAHASSLIERLKANPPPAPPRVPGAAMLPGFDDGSPPAEPSGDDGSDIPF